MPAHLAQVDIEALGISNELSKWISSKDDHYAPSSEPNLEKCIAIELNEKTEPLRRQAAARLYANVGKVIHKATNGTLTA